MPSQVPLVILAVVLVEAVREWRRSRVRRRRTLLALALAAATLVPPPPPDRRRPTPAEVPAVAPQIAHEAPDAGADAAAPACAPAAPVGTHGALLAAPDESTRAALYDRETELLGGG